MNTDGIKLTTLKNSKWLYIALAILLITIVGFRPIGMDRDSQVYYNEIIDYVHGSQSFTLQEREPMYFLIVFVAKAFGDFAPRLVFIIYALISIVVLFMAIKRDAKYPYMSVFLYICFFYLILNFTQVRASVAASLYLYSLDDISNKNFNKFTIKILIAVLFHYSAMMIFPFYFVTTQDTIKQKLFYGFLPMLGLTLGSIDLVHLYSETVSYVGHNFEIIPSLSKLDGYFNTVQLQGSIKPLNLYICSLIMFLWIGLYIKNKDSVFVIVLKLLGWSLFFYYIFRSVPVISHRFFQLISVPVILILPEIFSLIAKYFNIFISRLKLVDTIQINEKILWCTLTLVYGMYRLLIILFKDKIFY